MSTKGPSDNLALVENGAKVAIVTSEHPEYPSHNILDA